MIVKFYDTSALLNASFEKNDCIYVSSLVLRELENIKTSSSKDEHQKYLARKVINDIIKGHQNVWFSYCVSQRKINRLIKKYDFLNDINDHRILCEALILKRTMYKNDEVRFITSDGALYLAAKQFNEIKAFYVDTNSNKKESKYCGWTKYYPTAEQLAAIYTNLDINTLNAKVNEFCEIYEGAELKDVLFWNGSKYTNLKYSNFTSPFGEKIAPRNLEQKMLFHLLQNNHIKIKLAQGGFGTGKSLVMLQHAIQGIKEGRFSKIVYVRNNIITKGSREIGYLSGSLLEKIRPFMMQLADLTSVDYLDQMIEEGVLEPVPLGFMRGRDFSNNTLVFCDEAENLTKENVQLLIGRIGEGSELWLAGDLKQIDHKDFEKNNGLRALIEGLAGEELFGMVRLIKSERSKTSQLADKLDNIGEV